MPDPADSKSTFVPQRNSMISVRLSAEQKKHLAAAAQRAGHPSLSAYAIDRLMAPETTITDRQKRVLIGRLGCHGARLTALAKKANGMAASEIVAELSQAAADVVVLQRAILM